MYGQSAGAGIALMHSYATPNDPIMKGYIASSSATPTSNPNNSTNFHSVAQIAGCANLTADAELACMQAVGAQTLNNAVDTFNTDPWRGIFRPIADGVTAFANLTDRLAKGLVAKSVTSSRPSQVPSRRTTTAIELW